MNFFHAGDRVLISSTARHHFLVCLKLLKDSESPIVKHPPMGVQRAKAIFAPIFYTALLLRPLKILLLAAVATAFIDKTAAFKNIIITECPAEWPIFQMQR